MYRGNMPGQYNGSGMPGGQDYNHPMYGSRAPPHPNAAASNTMQSQMMAGQTSGQQPQSVEMQRFQSVPGYPGSGQVQPGYGAPHTGSYSSTDPYMYNHGKMMSVRSSQQSFPPDMTPSSMASTPGGHMYPGGMASQSRLPGSYPTSASENSSAMQYRHTKVGGGMYNGSQYMGGTMQMGMQDQRQPMQQHSRHPIPSQQSNYPGADASQPLGGTLQQQQQYGQTAQSQMATMPGQYQQRPGMVGGSTSASMSMYGQQQHQQQAFTGQPSAGQKTAAQFDEQMLQMQQQAQGSGAQQQAGLNTQPGQQQPGMPQQMQQNVMQSQMKPGAQSQYRGKMPTANAQGSHQSQQMLGMPGHPMQPSMSPHHSSPVSPMRASMTPRQNANMPLSPLPSRTTPQYPAPQASPHVHQAGPMSPNARMPAYSPKQQQQMQQNQQFMNQGQVTPGYRPSVAPSRTPTPRNEQSSRGFMSPPHMMSPPPSAPHTPSVARSPAPRMQVSSYNGESAITQQPQHQQQHGYYSSQMRYPHTSWQGPRPPVPSASAAGPTAPHMPHQQSSAQVPRFGQHQMYGAGQGPQAPSSMGMGVRSQLRQTVQYGNANQVSSSFPSTIPGGQPQQVPSTAPATDFDNDFNLDSLLGDAMDGTGSFMQQLQEVTPAEPAKSQPDAPASAPAPAVPKPDLIAEAAIESKIETLPPVTSAPPQKPAESTLPVPDLPQVEASTAAVPVIPEAKGQTPVTKVDASVVDSTPTVTTPAVADSNEQPPLQAGLQPDAQPTNDTSSLLNAETLPVPVAPATEVPTVVTSVPPSETSPASSQVAAAPANVPTPAVTSPVASASLSPAKQPKMVATPAESPQKQVPAEKKPDSEQAQPSFGPHPPAGPNFAGPPSSATGPYSSSGPYRPQMPPSSMASHPGAQMRPQTDPASYPPQYRQQHPHGMPGMRPQQPGAPPHPHAMHPHDPSMVRGPGPHYPQGMHPSHQYPGHPHQAHPYRYGPHPQASAAPYMPGSGPPHARGPYPPAGPRMPGGPHGYPGPRPGYPPGMHPNQHQHLQQRLQVLRHEATQLQSQMQRAQQEEKDNPPPAPPTAPDPNLPPDQQPPIPPPPKSEQIKRRLMEVDGQIRQIMSQLHAQGPPQHGPRMMQDQTGSMTALSGPPGFPPPDGGSPSKTSDDQGKKKRPRKKTKSDKGENGEGTKKDKQPPKKKKKKDASEGDEVVSGGEKKKKKKKKVEKVINSDEGETMVAKTDEEIPEDVSTIDDSARLDDDSVLGETENESQRILSISDKQKLTKSSDKKKKKPPATLVKQKKKRKRGYDSSDEMNTSDVVQATPPPSPEDSLIEKRRSGRNVKRKRYNESIDLQFSGDDDEGDFLPVEAPKKHEPIVEMNDVSEEDEVMIVEKILSHRIRSKRVRRKSDSKMEIPASIPKIPEEPTETDGEKASDDASNNLTPLTVDTNQPHSTIPPPMLSPTSLKNPRIRRISMGIVEEEEEIEGEGETEFFIKYKNYSYLHCDWKTKEEIEDKRFDQKLKRYLAKNTVNGQLVYPELEVDEIFNPDFVTVDRVLDVTQNENVNDENQVEITKHYLVKWCSLPYEDSTWEREEDIDQDKIKQFEIRCRYRPGLRKSRPHKDTWRRMTEDKMNFCNNNVLRDYQFEGLNWLLFNWYNKRNCILADEMGLGKTIQSITFLQKIYDHGVKGPFLVVAPLSTIANWQREFESWTTINAVVYHGSQTSRDMIQTYEWFCRDENLDEIEGSYKMQAVITTYEMIVLDSPHLRDVEWRCMIIDEGHRLKNVSCKLVESFRNMSLEHKVLLTGTPLQNNVEELFALLSFLQPDTFTSQQAFSHEFGNLKDNAQVEKLQELLKPMMLRRLKEDVEKSLAPKQETIIEVELTNIQKKYYRAILERNFEFLAKGTGGGNVPNLMNTMMELRKCCNHPYLIKGAEDKIMQEERQMKEDFDILQAMIQSSGKLVLIDKLLPRLKEGGHKVLIFSQMVRVLDILEDYLVQRSYLYERIDGCIRGNERQMAIDRFCRKGSDRFVFLLCTRAGGLGINLTAADTVIIFDSDWNPQNDLQAQARCHRIGQQKLVKIYRLITRNSYEREMFDKASLKLGLDKAVLQSISGRQNQDASQTQGPQLSKSEVEDLLKRGAYGAIMDDDDAASKFCEEDIDQILDRRAHTVTLESGEKGSTFSKASFVSAEDRSDISLDDPQFWEKWARKADLDLERLNDNKLILQIPRNRKQTRRFGRNTDDQDVFAEIGSESEDSELDSDDESRGRKAKFRSRAGGAGGGQRKGWSRRDCFRIEKCLLVYGWGRWATVQTKGRFGSLVSEEELEEMSRTVLMYCLKYYNGDEKIKFFMWDLITPQEIAEKTGVDLRNHEGLAAPVPRGRKGKRVKEDSERQRDEQQNREWAKDMNLEMLLPDEGFRKHIQHQCNKVLLRVRMLYYLRTEILGPLVAPIDSNEKFEDVDLDLVDRINDPPIDWWDQDCDKCLMIGVYKHGYEKYNMIRADPNLCFLERVGPPDERLLAAEMEGEPDDAEGDPEYKPTRITFTEIDFDQNSPSSSTPNTEPASPASVDSSGVKSKKDEDQKDSGDGKEMDDSAKKSKQSERMVKDWPSVSELNTRLRRLITMYQKHYKQMQQRLMNMDRRSGRPRYQDSGRESRRPVIQSRWTRREEADFYRTVSTFGVERDPRSGDLLWRRFRNIARLDRKTDESLRWYYLAFRNMCEQVCRWKGAPGTSDGTNIGVGEEIPNIDVDPITEERASRTLYRIRLLDKIRTEVLNHPKLKERLNLCQRSPDLPIWWRCGLHDHELLIAMDRHGVTRTEIHTLNDPNLSFLSSMKEYEADPATFKQQVLDNEKAELESLLEKMKKEQESKAKEEEESVEKKSETDQVKVEASDVKDKTEDDDTKVSPDEVKEEEKVSEAEETKPEDKAASTPPAEEEEEQPKKMEEKTKSPDLPDGEDVEKDQPEISPVSEMEVDPTPPAPPPEEDVESKEEVKEEKEKVAPPEKQTEEEKDEKLEVKPKDDAEMQEKEEHAEEMKQETETEEKTEPKPEVESMEVDENSTKEKEEAKEDKSTDVSEEGKLKMSLRSKPTSELSSFASSYAGMGTLSSTYMIQSMTGRWPKDRVLIQRVENICYCILNGEWPSANQTLLTVGGQAGQSGAGGSRSQTSTPLSFTSDGGRGTPNSSASSMLPPVNADVNMMANQKQLQDAINQLLGSNAETSMRMQSSYTPRSRGRKRRNANPQMMSPSTSQSLPFPASSLPPVDKSLQRKIEQLMAAGNPAFSFAGSSTSNSSSLFGASGFSPSSRGESSSMKASQSSLSKDEELGNSSVSLLRELAKSETSEKSSGSRGRSSKSGYRQSQTHSPSPSRSRAKDQSAKLTQDLLKAQQQAMMPTPEQLLAANNTFQQLIQDAVKTGMDPMTAAAAFLPLFPMMDPFQMLNPGKPENFPQLPQMPAMPSPAEMEKILKSMGMTPEIAMMSGLLPPGMLPQIPTSTSSSQSRSDNKESSSEAKSQQDASKSSSEASSSATKSAEKESSSDKSIANLIGEKRSTPSRKGGSKLDAMFGPPKVDDESPARSGKQKARKSKFVSPAMLPPNTRIPVHNNTEGVRIAGDEAPLNKDLADWLKDNTGFVVDYQALRQQLDESGSKKGDSSEGGADNSEQEADSIVSPIVHNSPKLKELKSKILEADELLKSAEKLVETTKMQQKELELNEKRRSKTPDKSRHVDPFMVPNPIPGFSPSSSRAGSSSSNSQSATLKQQQQQLSDLALLQQMGVAQGIDPTTAALFSLPPEVLGSLASLPPDVATLIAGGLIPGGLSPDVLTAMKPPAPRTSEDKSHGSDRGSPSRSSTPSRASPTRHSRSHHHSDDRGPPSDASQLSGNERVTVVNLTTGKKLTGRQAPELSSLAEYLRSRPDMVVTPDWSNVIRKSKFLPKDLHTRLLPSQPSSSSSATASKTSSSKSSSSSSAASSSAANQQAALAAAALGGLPPQAAAAMFPGLLQGQGGLMADPMQLMAALQMPGQGQMPDMKALAASGFPMLPFFGDMSGFPNPLAFPPQDPNAFAAMAALAQNPGLSAPKKEQRSSSSHERSSSDSGKSRKSRKSDRGGGRSSSSASSTTTSSQKQSSSFSGDPMAEALAALQRGGTIPGMSNPFLAPGMNPMLLPQMMMGGQGGNLLGMPLDMMNPELLATQMAAFGGIPGLGAAPPASTGSKSSNGGQSSSREQRRGSSSSTASASKSKDHHSASGQSRGGGDEQPMDLTQFGGTPKDRETPDKHK